MPDPLMDALPLDPNDPRVKAMGLGIRAPQLLGPLADLAKPQPPPDVGKNMYAVNPVGAMGQPPTPAAPSLSQQLAENQANKPDPNDPRFKVPTWKKVLGLSLATVGGIQDPNKSGELAENVLHGKYNRAVADWNQKGLAIEQQSKIGDTESQMREREAKATNLGTEKEDAVTHTYVDGSGNEVAVYKSGNTKVLGPAMQKDPAEKNLEKVTVVGPDGKPHTYGVNAKGERVQDFGVAATADKPEKPEKPLRQMVAIPNPDGSSTLVEAKPGMTIPKGAETVGEFGKEKKPTNDQERRANLATNLSENLDKLEDIAKRRPELFGPLAGRGTSVRQWAGSSDPDVAALATIKEQTGMAMVGTHAMRNAQHVEAAANAIMNAYKTPASALLDPKGPIAAARSSLKTFQDDAAIARGETPVSTGGKTPPATGPNKVIRYDAQGNRIP